MIFKKEALMLILVTFLFCINVHSQQISDPGKIEKIISKVMERSMLATVRIYPYDSLKMKPMSGGFSGVAVSKEGHILTAAHAIKINQKYWIGFPDGKNYVAKSLGRIYVKNDSISLDLGLIKIVEKGDWPFAEMGGSQEMMKNEPCISISYPESFNEKLPNVRFGRLTDIDYHDGLIVSTCKMEPGDSGGALFDSEGRVIGLHSFIRNSEEENFENPIYFYKKYWSALNLAREYKQAPVAQDLVFPVKRSAVFVIPPIQSLLKIPSKFTGSVVSITSILNGKESLILGTAVSIASKIGSKSYIISKSSMVGDQPMLLIGSQRVSSTVLARQKENDLVLLDLPSVQLKCIPLTGKDSVKISAIRPGKLLISALAGEKQNTGILSTALISVPRARGFFGANARFIDEKITITQIAPLSAAAGVLKLNDWITGINGVPISQPSQFGEQVSMYSSGDSISVELTRDGRQMQVKTVLKMYESMHPAYHFVGGRSPRSDGFDKALVQDAAIKANECGSPVFDSDRRFYGINIARHSRTSTIILPTYEILRFISSAVNPQS